MLPSETGDIERPGTEETIASRRGIERPNAVVEEPGHRVETLTSLEAAVPGWNALAEHARNPFATWEWADAWWRTFKPRGRLTVRRVISGGRLVGLLPLYSAERAALTIVRVVGHGPADEHTLLSLPGAEAQVIAALRDFVTGLRGGGLVLIERLAADASAGRALHGRVVRYESSPTLPIAGRSFDDWLASRTANFRQQARRLERRLARRHKLVFRMTTEPDRLDADLLTLFRLHHTRWRGASRAFDLRHQAFHGRFARYALERGWLRLWIAEIDGEPAAAYYGLRHAGVEWYYQLGWHPAWSRYSVGLVLLIRVLREAFEDRLDLFRLGLGNEPYKWRIAAEDPGLYTFALGGRMTRHLCAAAALTTRRMPAPIRQRVARVTRVS